MKFYTKKVGFVILYTMFTGIIASGILSIEGLVVLKIGLLLANIALFLYISCGITYQDGQKSYKILLSNDREREYMIKTGDICDICTTNEYHIRKGFLIGVFACVPLIILLALNLIITSANPQNVVVGEIAGFLYLPIYAFFNLDVANVHQELMYAPYYWTLLIIPLLVISQGVAYYLGAKKIEAQQESIKRTHQSIYGD